jgi:pimeloyl-ACP methyl ester carboxylesterase
MSLAMGNRATVVAAYRMMVANSVDPDDELLSRLLDGRSTQVAGAIEATKAIVRGGLSARAFHRRHVGYKGPVVTVWGDHDRIVPPSHMAGVATAFPHVEAHVWPAMGYHPQVERPTFLARMIEATCLGVTEDGAPTAVAA